MVKDIVGASNIPSSVTDAMIQLWINWADAEVDDLTGQTFETTYSDTVYDSTVNRVITKASAHKAAVSLCNRIIASFSVGENVDAGGMVRIRPPSTRFVMHLMQIAKEAVEMYNNPQGSDGWATNEVDACDR